MLRSPINKCIHSCLSTYALIVIDYRRHRFYPCPSTRKGPDSVQRLHTAPQSVVRFDPAGFRAQFLGVCRRCRYGADDRTKTRAQSVALFFMLLFLAPPPASAQIPGMGVINYFFDLNHIRLLSLCVLLPAFLRARRTNIAASVCLALSTADRARCNRQPAVAARNHAHRHVAPNGLHVHRSFSCLLRCQPGLKDLSDFKDALLAFVLAAMVLSIIGLFEFARSWLLYSALTDALGVRTEMSGYLSRGGSLRASATTGHCAGVCHQRSPRPLPVFARRRRAQQISAPAWRSPLAGGLFAPLSRGPWIGAVVMITAFIAGSRRCLLLALAAGTRSSVAGHRAGRAKILDLLPFIGTSKLRTSRTGNVCSITQ